eukprot:TRINITY_DN2539_c0_g1_i1.p1 TRINITY_DN2539_c0_g1~~TRINITY_DN2539_c0_g1_i1.p1  ORF type:complete len:1426 (+),score=450.66 TRINITY_DN2539_c0_g1_i1:135-4412(+)
MWSVPLIAAAVLLPGADANLRHFKPLSEYASTVVKGAAPGVRRYSHHEAYRHPDGSDLALTWHVHADPSTIMAVDLAEKDGMRVVKCEKDNLILRVPEKYVADVQKWRHVTASDRIHGCTHLADTHKHLYHEIQEVLHHAKLESGGAELHLKTKELSSPQHMFPYLHYSFHYMPANAKIDEEEDNQLEVTTRRLNGGLDMNMNAGLPTMQSNMPTGVARHDQNGQRIGEDGLPDTEAEPLTEAAKGQFVMGQTELKQDMSPDPENNLNSIFNFSPKQLSNLHWNWDYDADTQSNPEFEIKFPGGDGWLRLYKPYFKAHFGMTMNVTSHLGPVGSPPVVDIDGLLQGNADMKLDAATAVDFKEDSAMDPLNRLKLPFIGKTTHVINPLKFNVGGTVVQVDPQFTCHLNAYHIGQLQGSLRVSLDTKLTLSGLTKFNSLTGLQANFTAKMRDVKFTPPTWMIFTRHFELGLMLEPEIMLKGGMGMKEDMEFGIGVRPYMNVSLMQKGQENGRTPDGMSVLPAGGVGGGGWNGGNSVVLYPYRAIGLPNGQTYALQVEVNGEKRKTEGHMSIDGVCDFNEQLDKFNFGSMAENDLVGSKIKVSVLSVPDLNELASAETTCEGLASGECVPGPDSPMQVSMNVGGSNVLVLMSSAYSADPVTYMTGKVKGVSFVVPKLSGFPHSTATQLAKAGASVGFVLQRNGRMYELPLEVVTSKTTGKVELQGKGIYDLGLRFLDAWKEVPPSSGIPAQATQKPTLHLIVDGQEIARGTLPQVQWQQPVMGLPSAHDMTKMMAAISQGSSLTQKVPLSIALTQPTNPAMNIATGDMQFNIDDPSGAAYWVFPKQAETFYSGETKTLYWTTHMSLDVFSSVVGGSKKMPFTLGALKVEADGSLHNTGWHNQIHSSCKTASAAKIETYTGSAAQCVFSYVMHVPPSLAGNTLMFVMEWHDANNHLHRMLSSAVTFTAHRRLQTVTQAPASPFLAPGATTVPPGGAAPNSPWALNHITQDTTNQHRWKNSKGQSSQQDFAAHMAASADKCSEEPLEYSLGFGVLERTDVAGGQELEQMMNMVRMMELMSGGSAMMSPMGMEAMSAMTGMPASKMAGMAGMMGGPAGGMMGGGMGGMGGMGQMGGAAPMQGTVTTGSGPVQSPYSGMPAAVNRAAGSEATPNVLPAGNPMAGIMSAMSNPALFGEGVQTSYTPIMSENMEENLADLLPKSVCSGGLCNGELPGCKPQAVNPITLKQIVFRLSRMFKLEDFFSPQMREALAYGLATLPEAIDLGKTEMDEMQNGGKDSARRLKETGRKLLKDLDPKKDAGYESNTVHVRITKPLQWVIDAHMIQKLIDMNAFSLLEDGKEKTHGPVKIVGFHLVDPEGAEEQGEQQESSSPLVPLVGGAILCTMAVAMAGFRLSRKSGYTEVADESSLEVA